MTAPAQVLEQLVDRDGMVTPTSVVEEASDESSPLHDHFEWDDSVAGPRYRLVQAGHLIRRYRVTVVTDDERTIRPRALSLTYGDGGLGYRRTDEALSDPEQREFVLSQALREVAALRTKYTALLDFDQVLRTALGEGSEAA